MAQSRTSHFRFAIFGSTGVEGDATQPATLFYTPTLEAARWITADSNIGVLLKMLGNGVLSGFVPSDPTSPSTTVTFSAGEAIIGNYGATAGDVSVDLAPFTPTSGSPPVDLYLYAQKTAATYSDGSLELHAGEAVPADATGLALVRLSDTGALVKFNDTDTDYVHYADSVYTRPVVGVASNAKELVLQHIHDGKAGSPSKIDLAAHVTGKLPADNIADGIPVSKLSGSITIDNLTIPHGSLKDIGILTHAQLDEFAQFLEDTVKSKAFEKYGLVGTVNRLQHTISLMRHVGTTDPIWRLVNERPITPGITPAGWLSDQMRGKDSTGADQSPAIVDTTLHRIQGAKGTLWPDGVTGGTDQRPEVHTFWSAMNDGPAGNDFGGKLGEEYGFAGSTQRPFPETGNIRIVDGANGVSVTLAEAQHTNRYLPEGYFYARVENITPVQWTSISYTTTPTGTDLGDLPKPNFVVSVIATNVETLDPTDSTAWQTVAGDLSTLPKTRFLWVRCAFQASADRLTSPVLSDLTVVYDPHTDTRCSLLTYAKKVVVDLDTHTKDRDVEVNDTPCDTLDVTLTAKPLYGDAATFTGPIIDSGQTYVWWNKLYVASVVPGGTTIRAFVRSTADPTDPAGWNNSWASDFGWEEVPFSDCIDISAKYAGLSATTTGRHERYAQVKFLLTPSADHRDAPQLAGLSLIYYTEDDTGISQKHAIHFARSGADVDGWEAPKARLTNVDAAAVTGAISVLNPSAGQKAEWVSPPIRATEGTFQVWDTLQLVGEELHKCRFRLAYSKDGSPGSWVDERLPDRTDYYWYQPTVGTSPYILDWSAPPTAESLIPLDPLTPNTPLLQQASLAVAVPGTGDAITVLGLTNVPNAVAYKHDTSGSTDTWDTTLANMFWKLYGITSVDLNLAFTYGVFPNLLRSKTTGSTPAGGAGTWVQCLTPSGGWPDLSGYTLRDMHFPTTTVGYVGGDGGLVLKTTDAGDTWSLVQDPTTLGLAGTDSLYSVHFYDATHGAVAGGGNNHDETNHFLLQYTADGGATWETVTAPAGLGRTTDYSLRAVYMLSATTVLVGGVYNTLLQGTRTGSGAWTWAVVGDTGTATASETWVSLEWDRQSPGRVWAVCSSSAGDIRLWHTDDAGATWGTQTLSRDNDISEVSSMTWYGAFGLLTGMPPLLADWTQYQSYYIYRTTDSGATWQRHHLYDPSMNGSYTMRVDFTGGATDGATVVEEYRTYPYLRITLEMYP